MPASSSPQRRNPPAPRWKRRAEARPEEILEAALAEFDERGFDAARMEDIAKRAGLSKAGVYLYFESKEALLKALIEAKISPIAQNAQSIALAGAADPKLAMRMLVTAMATRFSDPKIFAVPRLVIGLSARFPDLADYYRTHVIDLAKQALESLIVAGIAQGKFRAVEPRAAVRAFVGPMLFEAFYTHVMRGPSVLGDPPKLVEEHLNLLLEGLEKRA
ncbi:TetR/AcrR family transcriptional regulator [Terricaulis sp.]|uniref:TetR/AcrR family transcriptional regulator n=1 Tax=Terricaulis sp. TaxID=2768686 RepID=UPI003784FBE3